MDSFEFGSEYTSLEQLPAFYHASKTTGPLEAVSYTHLTLPTKA